MPTEIIMPQLGESVVEGTVSKWLVAEGDRIEKFDPLLEVTTDKVDTEITAGSDGKVLSLLVQEGTTVRAGTLLGWIGEAGDQVPDAVEYEVASQPVQPPVSAAPAAVDLERRFISPVVARIAADHNVDIDLVPGTGRDGRVTKKDVLKYVAQHSVDPETAPWGVSSEGDPGKPPSLKSESDEQPAMEAREIKLSRMRRSIAEHMLRSKHTSAHVTTVFEADMSLVLAHRSVHQGERGRDDANVTVTAYLVVASAAALATNPMINSSLLEDKILLKKGINVGVAVSLGEDGLIVPVIRNAGEKSLRVIADELNDLTARAREKQLKPDEVRDGTFTVTNHGVSGSLMATPIINQPQCAILGVGAIQKRAVVIEDAVVIRPMVYLTLSFDHRIVDGAIANDFLAKVKEVLEGWV